MSLPGCTQPGCNSWAGNPVCYTATGFPRSPHAVRRRPAAVKKAGGKAGVRPSERQHAILAQALADGGQFELSGYRFAGDAQRQAAMHAMAGDERGWFRLVKHTDHGSLYEITDVGREAYARYERWMNGGTR